MGWKERYCFHSLTLFLTSLKLPKLYRGLVQQFNSLSVSSPKLREWSVLRGAFNTSLGTDLFVEDMFGPFIFFKFFQGRIFLFPSLLHVLLFSISLIIINNYQLLLFITFKFNVFVSININPVSILCSCLYDCAQ